jgi:transcriptional regulator
MYIPPHFRQDNAEVLIEFIAANSFGLLISVVEGSPFSTHLPLLYIENGSEHGLLRGHVALANPQWRALKQGGEALAVFSGPHVYISPSWYITQPSVPTWNYAAVHVYGNPRIATQSELMETLRATVEKYESERVVPWRIESLPEEYLQKMAQAVVGFEIEITRIEGKFKLSQNRSQEDIANVVAELEQSGAFGCAEMAELMRAYSLAQAERGS